MGESEKEERDALLKVCGSSEGTIGKCVRDADRLAAIERHIAQRSKLTPEDAVLIIQSPGGSGRYVCREHLEMDGDEHLYLILDPEKP